MVTPFQLGPYEALQSLGSGGFASVYRARDVRTGAFVALKVVHSGTDDETVRRLMREARAVSRMSHPNVIKVYECGVAPEGAYVAMELLEGRTLEDVLDANGPMEFPRALDLALQLLDGLAAAHESRIIHRDVKPGNIFLTKDTSGREIPHLLDFGVSKLGATLGSTMAQDRTLPGTALGTPGFMAPEQYGSAHAADARADVYGAAATLYAMLTGRLPFEAGTYESWLVKVKGERAPSIQAAAPHLSPQVAQAIDRALARDPDARWATARDFARALVGSSGGLHGDPTTRGTRPGDDYFVDTTAPAMLRSPTPRSPSPQQDRTHDATGVRKSTMPQGSVAPSTPRMDPSGPYGNAGPSGTSPASEPATEPRPEPFDMRKPERKSRRKSRSSGGGLWFASGALVGALLAALGAGIAFWARSHQPDPAPPAPTGASADPAATRGDARP
jgi:serine/threonine protein kinase